VGLSIQIVCEEEMDAPCITGSGTDHSVDPRASDRDDLERRASADSKFGNEECGDLVHVLQILGYERLGCLNDVMVH
jgi:hypothetical protein